MGRVEAIEPGPPPVLDPERHYLEGSREDVAAYLLTLDAINFGSGWFPDVDRLTIFADNLVPHVLRMDGVLVYADKLAARIDAGELLEPGGEEREIRACAVHAGEQVAAELGVPPRVLDTWLWNRGQEPRYKATPRHRCRTVFY